MSSYNTWLLVAISLHVNAVGSLADALGRVAALEAANNNLKNTVTAMSAANKILKQSVDRLTAYVGMLSAVGAPGVIVTVAGNGSPSFGGDGGSATSGSLQNPTGIAFHPNGTLFIADSSNHRIRKVDASGMVTTVVG